MATPLRWFRKNQKLLLIVFGVSLMIVFLLPQLFDSSGFSTGGQESVANTTVAEFKGATITNGDISEIQHLHFRAHNILSEMQRVAFRQMMADGNSRGLPNLYESVQVDNLSPQNINRVFMRRLLLIKEGGSMGIKISDDTVTDYISTITGGMFKTDSDIDAEVRRITKNQIDYAKIKPQIKQDLLFTRTQELAQVGLPILPNLNRAWEIFKKLNVRIQCDVLPISIEDEVEKITEQPSASEMKTLFDEGQYQLEDLSHVKPGFKIGPRIAIGYFEADFDTFLKKAENNVTPEQVEAEYMRLVEIKSDIVVEKSKKPIDTLGLDFGADQKSGDQNSAGSEDNTGEKKDDVPQPPTEESKGEENTESGKKDDNGSEENKSGENKSGEEKPGEEKDNQSSTGIRTSFVSLVNTQDTETQDTEGQESSTQETAAQNTDQPVEAPKDEERIRPLSEVADQIKTQLATDVAAKKMAKSIREASVRVFDYQLDVWKVGEEQGISAEKRAAFDGQKIADEFGLIYNTTKLLGIPEFIEEEIAKKPVTVYFVDEFGEQQGQPGFLANFFLSDFHKNDLYSPRSFTATSPAIPGQAPDQYVVWATQKGDPKIRTFEESKDDIIRYWRYQRAKENVVNRAKAIAADLEGQTLREKFPEQVKDTGGITWYNEMTQQLSSVPNVEKAGEDFFKTAFALKEKQAGVTTNYDNTEAYVIYVTYTDKRRDEDLKDQFYQSFDMMNKILEMNLNFPSPLMTQHRMEFAEVYNEWDEYIAEKYNLKWLSQ